MNQLLLRWDTLCQAYWHGDWENRYYLDRETGEVVCITELLRVKLQSIYDEVGEDSADALIDLGELALAHTVEMNDDRYLKIIEWKSFREEADAFAMSVDPPLRALLWQALDLQNRVGFEKNVQLESSVAVRWQQFKRECAITRLQRWVLEIT